MRKRHAAIWTIAMLILGVSALSSSLAQTRCLIQISRGAMLRSSTYSLRLYSYQALFTTARMMRQTVLVTAIEMGELGEPPQSLEREVASRISQWLFASEQWLASQGIAANVDVVDLRIEEYVDQSFDLVIAKALGEDGVAGGLFVSARIRVLLEDRCTKASLERCFNVVFPSRVRYYLLWRLSEECLEGLRRILAELDYVFASAEEIESWVRTRVAEHTRAVAARASDSNVALQVRVTTEVVPESDVEVLVVVRVEKLVLLDDGGEEVVYGGVLRKLTLRRGGVTLEKLCTLAS